MQKIVLCGGEPHYFEDVRFVYGDGEPWIAVKERYRAQDMDYELLYLGESVDRVPDTEEELDDWLAYPLPNACYHYDAETDLYRVRKPTT